MPFINDNDLPPILRTPGLRLIHITRENGGWIHLHFESRRPKREVTVAISGLNILFTYSMHDHDTHTMLTYQGPYGDPERDEHLDIEGL